MTPLDPLAASHAASLVVALKTLTLALGGLITFLALKAARRTGSTSLQLLAIGFGLVTAGSLVAGVIDQVVGLPVDVAVAAQSGLTVVGFAVILVSLYRK